MGSPSHLLSLICLCFALASLYPFSCYAADHYFFIFGDSLYDPGNNIHITPNNYIPAYHPPYGTTFFRHSTGRFSDGRVVPDFIAEKLNLPFMPAILDPDANFRYGANFASGGAGITNDNPNALSFAKQVELFKELAAKWRKELGTDEANKRLSNAVYLIAMGGNDYFSYVNNNPGLTMPEHQVFVNSVLDKFIEEVSKIYSEGGRKFMFQNVAPIGCMPMMKQNFNITNDGCAGLQTTVARLHNDALVERLLRLRVPRPPSFPSYWPGFIFRVFDFFHEIGNRIKDPTKYGFKVGDVACCGSGSHRASGCGSITQPYDLCFDPNEYVYFDGGHNTDRANSQMADQMWNAGLMELFDMEVKPAIEWGPYGRHTEL